MELPRLEEIWQKHRDKGLVVVAVERNRDTERARTLIADKKLTFPLLENGEGDQEVVRKVFNVGTFPTSFLIDRRGRVVFAHVGYRAGDDAKIERELLLLLHDRAAEER